MRFWHSQECKKFNYRKKMKEAVKVLNIDIQNITRQELLENLKEGVLVTPNLDYLIKL